MIPPNYLKRKLDTSSVSGLCGDALIFYYSRTPNVGYPGESGTGAPCFTGIAWANVVIA